MVIFLPIFNIDPQRPLCGLFIWRRQVTKKRIARITRLFGNLLMVASLIYIIRSIAFADVKPEDYFQPKVLITVPCLAVMLAAGVFLSAYAWKHLLEIISGNTQSYLEVATVYTRSNLGKYLPGNIMHIIMRNTMGDTIHAHQAEIALSTFVELTMFAFSGLLISAVLSWKNLENVIMEYKGAYHIIIALSIIGVIIIVISAIKWNKTVISRLRSIKISDLIRVTILGLCCFGVMICLYGIAMVVNLSYQVELTREGTLQTFSAYTISWLVGFIIIGAPGGLGVREASFLFLMNGVYDHDILLSSAVLNRITTTLGDLLAGGCGILIKRNRG